VRITRGQNQLEGSEAEVNMKTGISNLLAATGQRVQGLVVPNDATSQQLTGSPAAQEKTTTGKTASDHPAQGQPADAAPAKPSGAAK
jgi:lipopolysaccharide export system protein LptA